MIRNSKLKNYDYKEIRKDFLTYNDWTSGISPQEKERLIQHLLTQGLSRKEAEDYCNRNITITQHFQTNPTAGYTFMKGMIISYGRKTDASA